MKRRVFLLSSSAVLTGCATPPSLPLVNTDSSVKGCCSVLSEAAYIKYAGNSIVRLGIAAESQSFVFPGGTSQFAGLELAGSGAYGLLETTVAVEGFFLPTATILIPSFMFLDSSFREISTVEPVFFQNTGKHEDSRYSTYYGACFIPPASRYIVVFSDPRMLQSARVRYLKGGGLGADMQLNRVREEFKGIDKRLYASRSVRSFDPDRGYAVHDLRRQLLGEVRISLTSAAEL